MSRDTVNSPGEPVGAPIDWTDDYGNHLPSLYERARDAIAMWNDVEGVVSTAEWILPPWLEPCRQYGGRLVPVDAVIAAHLESVGGDRAAFLLRAENGYDRAAGTVDVSWVGVTSEPELNLWHGDNDVLGMWWYVSDQNTDDLRAYEMQEAQCHDVSITQVRTNSLRFAKVTVGFYITYLHCHEVCGEPRQATEPPTVGPGDDGPAESPGRATGRVWFGKPEILFDILDDLTEIGPSGEGEPLLLASTDHCRKWVDYWAGTAARPVEPLAVNKAYDKRKLGYLLYQVWFRYGKVNAKMAATVSKESFSCWAGTAAESVRTSNFAGPRAEKEPASPYLKLNADGDGIEWVRTGKN